MGTSRNAKEPIRHVACPPDGNDYFATAEFEHHVTTWSFHDRKRLVTFRTGLDFGGRRLAILSKPRPVVVVGAWERHGVCAYDALNGELLWQRKDLKKTQRLFPCDEEVHRARLGVDLYYKSFRLLELSSGNDVAKLRGVGAVAFSLGSGHLLACTYDTVSLYDHRMTRLWKARTGAMIASCALGPCGAVVATLGLPAFLQPPPSIGGGTPDHSTRPHGLIMYDLQGRKRWECDGLITDVVWSVFHESWLAVERREDASQRLRFLGYDGSERVSLELGKPADLAFMDDGRYLVTSNGQVLEIPSLRVVWEFERPA